MQAGVRPVRTVQEGQLQAEEPQETLQGRQVPADGEWLSLWRQWDVSQRWLRHHLRQPITPWQLFWRNLHRAVLPEWRILRHLRLDDRGTGVLRRPRATM